MNAAGMFRWWRHGLLLLIVVGSFAFLWTRKPFGQDPGYHDFADRRAFLGVPNFFDVATNVLFLGVGLSGLKLCLRGRFAGASLEWSVFFAGVALVSLGSAYYHWRPSDSTLVWDRLPMTIGFMAMFAALLGEFLGEKLGRMLLAPALLAGMSSVVYWSLFDDLRFYAWVQLIPLLLIPVVMGLFRGRYSHGSFLLLSLGFYVLAKVAEAFDRQIFDFTRRAVGGHAAKHVLAAGCCFVILEMLKRRRPVQA